MKLTRSLGIGTSRSGFLLALTIMIMMVFSLSAKAQNQYYVAATGGNDSNSGTSVGSPWATCNHAVATATLNSTGAIINFIASSSTHAACSDISRNVVAPARMILKCTAPWTAATHCKMAGGFHVTGANNIDIGAIPQLGFDYSNSQDDTAVNLIWQCGIAASCTKGNGIHILGNYFHDIAQGASGFGLGCPGSGAIFVGSSNGSQGGTGASTDIQIIGNTIDHFGVFPNSSCSEAHGIYVTGTAIVYNNIITRSAAAGIQVYGKTCNNVVSNNVLVNNEDGLILYGHEGCAPGFNTINNNVIANNLRQAFVNGGNFGGSVRDCSTSPVQQALMSNNIIFGNGNNSIPTSSCQIVQNQKSENPTATFVNYTGTASGDYHLKPGSIANNSGTRQCTSGGTSACAPSVDLAFKVRPAQLSLGAFESQGDSNASAPSAPSGLTASVQ